MSRQVTVSYEVWLADQVGTRLRVLPQIESIDIALTLNQPGVLTVTFPRYVNNRAFALRLINEDSQLEVWRSVDGLEAALVGDTVFLVQRYDRFFNSDDIEYITIIAYSAAVVATYPIVAYDAGTSYASKDSPADDMIKQIARENMGACVTDLNRDMSTLITIQENVSLGASVSKSFSRNILSNLFSTLCNMSTESGSRIYWDVVVTNPKGTRGLELRTFSGQRGNNKTSSSTTPVIFSPSRGNLKGANLSYSWAETAHYIYTGGQGQGDDRVIRTASSASRIGNTPWGRIKENWKDARNLSNASSVQFEANATLQERKPRRILTGQIINTPAARFGVEWNHGDKVTFDAFDLSLDAVISPLRISYKAGQETINVALTVED